MWNAGQGVLLRFDLHCSEHHLQHQFGAMFRLRWRRSTLLRRESLRQWRLLRWLPIRHGVVHLRGGWKDLWQWNRWHVFERRVRYMRSAGECLLYQLPMYGGQDGLQGNDAGTGILRDLRDDRAALL